MPAAHTHRVTAAHAHGVAAATSAHVRCHGAGRHRRSERSCRGKRKDFPLHRNLLLLLSQNVFKETPAPRKWLPLHFARTPNDADREPLVTKERGGAKMTSLSESDATIMPPLAATRTVGSVRFGSAATAALVIDPGAEAGSTAGTSHIGLTKVLNAAAGMKIDLHDITAVNNIADETAAVASATTLTAAENAAVNDLHGAGWPTSLSPRTNTSSRRPTTKRRSAPVTPSSNWWGSLASTPLVSLRAW
jgi:hypothetical protein